MKAFRFTDEAILYAKHLEVVEEMRKRFEANIRGFVDDVAEKLKERDWPGTFTYVVNGTSAYYWLSNQPEPSADHEPVAWCNWKDAGIIRDHGVMMGVTRARGSSEQRMQVAALADHPTLAQISHKKNPSVWSIFDVWISWHPDQDPVAATVGALDPLLRLLNSAR